MKSPQAPTQEVREALMAQRPHLRRAFWFSVTASLLVLAPTLYMLEVYDRVVNSRSHLTLVSLTVLVIGAYVVMEVLDWARGAIMVEAGHDLEQRLAGRVFTAVMGANLRRQAGGSQQPVNDLRTIRDFMASPVVGGLMEAPTALVFLVLVFLINPKLGWMALVGAVW